MCTCVESDASMSWLCCFGFLDVLLFLEPPEKIGIYFARFNKFVETMRITGKISDATIPGSWLKL